MELLNASHENKKKYFPPCSAIVEYRNNFNAAAQTARTLLILYRISRNYMRIPCAYLFLDETLDLINQKEHVALNSGFWKNSDEAERQFYTSAFIGHTRAIDILLAFDESIESLRKVKLSLISLDGPNVNLKFIESSKQSYEKDNLPKLIDTDWNMQLARSAWCLQVWVRKSSMGGLVKHVRVYIIYSVVVQLEEQTISQLLTEGFVRVRIRR